MRKLFAIAALCLSLPVIAQENDMAVSISGGPPARAWSTIYVYTVIGGADYISYICYARTSQPNLINTGALPYTVTQIVDSGSTSTVTTSENHGLSVNNRVVVSGVSGDTDLNGIYSIATVPSATTFTITTANVTDATYNNAAIKISSTAPRTNRNIWSIKRFYYGGTGGTSLVGTKWAVAANKTISSTGSENSCDDRVTLSYQ